MFSNLVHMEFLRLMKSRYLKAAISLAFFVGIFFFVMLHYSMSEILESQTIVSNPRGVAWYQITLGFAFINLTWAVIVLAVIFTTCDYYKYRLFVNIQNCMGGKIKLCIAEFVGFFLFCCVMGIIPFVSTYFLSFLDVVSLFTNPFKVVALYSIIVLTLFQSSLSAIFLAKLFKRVWPSIICFVLYNWSKGFLLGFVVGFISADDNTEFRLIDFFTSDNYIYVSSVFNPANTILQCLAGSSSASNISLPLVLFNLAAIIMFWTLLCCLITKRRVSN